MSAADRLIEHYRPLIGSEIHVGPWLEITQERIDRFAEVTGDLQWIHTDPERAAAESPYRATIAHGYLTLSLLPYLTESNHPDFFDKSYPGMRLRVNYGLDRLRFPAPVLVGSKIRAHTLVKGTEKIGEAVQFTYLITVEIDGGEKPACVAEFLARVYP
ncbi:MaoC family dehydratase [Desulfuromonas versatilis]|uniref:MaoC family dehydratase n=1 Tax=Desulfuromonas versatilis TaxID=2802975 RepID=A0ABN6DWQ5_9BACT|nr:MaoC family dehydratase [Desulfuromonas versatilis]BCR04561.1 MaoC family dehydratase [Desulfuromonas versatilis]